MFHGFNNEIGGAKSRWRLPHQKNYGQVASWHFTVKISLQRSGAIAMEILMVPRSVQDTRTPTQLENGTLWFLCALTKPGPVKKTTTSSPRPAVEISDCFKNLGQSIF